MNLRNLKTSTKLILGFGIIITLTVGIAIAGRIGIQKVHSQSIILSKLGSVTSEYNLARVYTRSYAHTRDTFFHTKMKESFSKVSNDIIGLKDYTTNKTEKEILDSLQIYISMYFKESLGSAQNIADLSSVIAKEEQIGGKIISELSQPSIKNNTGFADGFNKVRFHSVQYILTYKDSQLQKSISSLDNLLKRLNGLNDNALTENLHQYNTVLDELNDIGKKQAGFDKTIPPIGGQVTTLFDKLMAHANGEAANTKNTSTLLVITFTVIAFLLALIISYSITRYLTSRLQKVMNIAQEYADGNLTATLSSTDLVLKDEIGLLMRAISEMGRNIKDVVRLIHRSSENVSNTTNQINTSARLISSGANKQAASAEELSASMEEAVSSMQQNVENASNIDTFASESGNDLKVISTQSQNSLKSVEQISQKIGIINDIAFQTNILALNAAVEAARAGSGGKGFSVVATEIRKLAEKSKGAATEIIALSEEGFQMTKRMVSQLSEVVPKIEKSLRLIKEITNSSKEQLITSQQINSVIESLNEITQQNVVSYEKINSKSEELTTNAKDLLDSVVYFKINETNI
ncbi:methyl-accepting chemotaxis protein [Marinilabilia sp.]|uniref:methyl-accepting chemotaxis protein n=1 Tax=Marinilabilia sp. TaxID=2021252 RepID=UPI0025C11B0A|nr:methyl-accepting chemotaxis protein [Marinilabilia sp.]